MPLNLTTRMMEDGDAVAVAHVHRLAFPRQTKSLEWVRCSLAAYPKCLAYVCEADADTLAYVFWAQRSGFRPSAVLELEQVAVLPDQQRRGIATQLIRESLGLARAELDSRGASIKAITISTRTDNAALRLYERTLGARQVATIPDLYSADEAILVARGATSET